MGEGEERGRACGTCEWAREHISEPKNLRCCEGPQRMTVTPEYWCGRWRLAERLSGNRDMRKRA